MANLSTAVVGPETRASRRISKRIAYAIDDVTPSRSGVVVLAYHRVGQRTPSAVDLPEAQFRRQMAHLTADLRVFTIDTLLAASNEQALWPDASRRNDGVVVTFDDGTADFVDIVLPILVKYAIPATLYVATSFVDSGTPFPERGEPISWAGLREALDTGLVTIGAHTHDHVLLDRCDVATASEQLRRCNERIEDELGVTPKHFAYPKALPADGAVENIVRTTYQSAAIAGTRANDLGTFDRYRIQRSPVQLSDGWEGFRRKLAGGMSFEDDVRRLANRYRYRGKRT